MVLLKSKLTFIILVTTSFLFSTFAQDSLSTHLKVLRPFINKTWKAQVAESQDGSPVYDVAKCERALNGNGERILHSVNKGAYGGETIIMWDKTEEGLIFYYFTTAGFYTMGTVTIELGKMIRHEVVSGNDTVSEVKSISEINKDGNIHVITKFLKNGKWTESKEVIYYETPDAEVIFK